MVGKLLFLNLTLGLVAGCPIHPESKQRMDLQDMLAAVRNDGIKFATMRPPNSEFTSLERRVIVTGPPELVKLSASDDPQVLNHLVELLRDWDRAWAAEVLLAAMTRREDKIVDSFAATPDKWWDAVGKTAYDRWNSWLTESRSKLVWDSENKVFVETN
jgi:hypothetical protein